MFEVWQAVQEAHLGHIFIAYLMQNKMVQEYIIAYVCNMM